MKFRSSAAAMLAAVLLCPTAKAEEHAPFTKPQLSYFVDAMPIAKEIRKVAPIHIKDCETDEWAGWMTHGRTPSITVCANAMSDLGELQDTLNHEGIHLAQWCRGSDSIYAPKVYKAFAKDKGYPELHSYAHKHASDYETSEYDSEFEAYWFTQGRGSTVIEYIQEECK